RRRDDHPAAHLEKVREQQCSSQSLPVRRGQSFHRTRPNGRQDEQALQRPHQTGARKPGSHVPTSGPTTPPAAGLPPPPSGNHPPRKGGEGDRRDPDRNLRMALRALARRLLPTQARSATRTRIPVTTDEHRRNQRLLLLPPAPRTLPSLV